MIRLLVSYSSADVMLAGIRLDDAKGKPIGKVGTIVFDVSPSLKTALAEMRKLGIVFDAEKPVSDSATKKLVIKRKK